VCSRWPGIWTGRQLFGASFAAVARSAVEPRTGGLQATVLETFEVAGGTRPVCLAELLHRFYA